MSRLLRNLLWAREASGSPWPATRARGAKLAGLRYEKAVGKALPAGFLHGRWFEFQDAEGRGFAQTDYIEPSLGLCLEVKYTWTPAAHLQLDCLYLPILREVYGGSWRGVVVCKNLLPGMRVAVFATLREALSWRGGTPVVHWLPSCPLWTLGREAALSPLAGRPGAGVASPRV